MNRELKLVEVKLVEESHRPIMSVEKLKSLDVVDKTGEKIGSAKDLLVDPAGKRIHYVLLGAAGALPTLGLADKLYAIPVFAFKFEDGRIMLVADKESLKNTPSFSAYSPPDFNREYEAKLADHWGTPRYWDIPLYHLEETTAKDVMVRDVPTIRPDTPITEVSRIMAERGVDELPIIDDQGRVIGYATAQEMTKVFSAERKMRPTVTEEGRAPAMPEKQEPPPAPGL